MTERRRWFRDGWFSSKIGIAAALVIFVVSASANFKAGQALSTDRDTAIVLGLASIAVDILKSIFFFCVVTAALNRRWLAMTLALLIFSLCLSWSMRSATMFMFATLEQHAANVDLEARLQKTDLDVLSLRTTRAQFLAQQSVKVVGPRGTRTDALEANKATSIEFAKLLKDIDEQRKKLAADPAVVSQDPLAAVLELPPSRLRTVSAIIFALILEVVSSLGFWVIVQSRNPKTSRIQEIRPETPSIPTILQAPPAQIAVEDHPSLPHPPMPEVVTAPRSNNVVPLYPFKAVLAPVEPPPVYEEIRSTIGAPLYPLKAVPVVIETLDPLAEIVGDLFEASPGDRALYKGVIDLINARLPEAEAITKGGYPKILAAMAAAFPVRKERVGGRVYLYGIRPKSLESRASVA